MISGSHRVAQAGLELGIFLSQLAGRVTGVCHHVQLDLHVPCTPGKAAAMTGWQVVYLKFSSQKASSTAGLTAYPSSYGGAFRQESFVHLETFSYKLKSPHL